MSCPIAVDELVLYWSGELPAERVDAIDEHLFGCERCFQAASRVAALAQGLKTAVPPVVVASDLERAQAAGKNVLLNVFEPGVPKEAWMYPDTDLLVHQLHVGSAMPYVTVNVELIELDGRPVVRFEDVPFDPQSGTILVACRAHFAAMMVSNDVNIHVRGTDSAGKESTTTFTVLHRYG